MSERFTRLFALPAALYAEGSPLLLEAGALLRDNENGRLIAQLKLKNLGEKAVQAAKIRLWPQDPAGRPLGGAIEYTYLDQSAGRGDSFGAKNPIPVAEGSTRSFRAELEEVIFADGSLWTAPEGAVWAPLPPAEPLEKALGDPELCKQLRLERGEDCRFRPARMLDLWRCACGEVERGEPCPACGKGFFEIDLAALTAAKDERLAAEKIAAEKAAAEAAEQAAALAKLKAERAEKAKARRKKAGKIAALAAAAVVVAAAILLGIPGLSDIQAGKAADAGDYIGAVEKYRSAAGWGLFNALFHPDEKAASLEPAARYQEGEEALAEGRYEDALAAFEAAGDYEDAAERRTASLSGAIEALAEAGELEKAEALLAEVAAGAEQERLSFALAEKTAEQGGYRRAYELFLQSGQKPEDEELWAACCAAAVREYAAEGDMEAALAARKAYPAGRGRNVEGKALNLDLAEGYLRVEDYGKAKHYLPSSAFQDAALEARRQEARYQVGLGLYGQGAYADAESYLNDGYKDSDHYYALCLVGETSEMADKGDYARAASVAGEVDQSKLTREEREAFREALYSTAAKAKNKGDYASAFALYRLSQTKDYQAQMDFCNEKYITTPRSILRSEGLGTFGVSIYHGLGSYGELTDVRCIYSKGQLTFTLYYTANRDLEWVLFRGPYNDNSFRSFTRGTVKKGSGSTSFTVSYSALRSYNETWIELYRNGGSGYDMVTLYSSDLRGTGDMKTSSAPACALGHLPRARGRLCGRPQVAPTGKRRSAA